MNKYFLPILCILIFLLMTPTTGYSNNDLKNENSLRERLVSIELKDQDMFQALEAIAYKVGVNFSFQGEKPEGQRDISLDQVALNDVVSRLVRMYNVRNLAVAYDNDNQTVILAVLGTPAQIAAFRSGRGSHELQDAKPLTVAQLARLREQSAIIVAEMEESMRPLTPEQLERLRERSREIEWEMEESQQPLTEEQLERLREQSFWIELEMEEASQPLTQEQMQRLREQSRRIQEEEERASQPLTEEQLQRLREQSQEP